MSKIDTGAAVMRGYIYWKEGFENGDIFLYAFFQQLAVYKREIKKRFPFILIIIIKVKCNNNKV